MYDHTGERISPRDVLSDQELRDYERTQRDRADRGGGGRSGPTRINGDGYDQHGDYHGTPGHWDDGIGA